MAELTKADQTTLKFCDDWSAPFEVAERRRGLGVIVYSRRVRQRMVRLTLRGFLQHSKANDTFRLTDAGRAALASEEKGHD